MQALCQQFLTEAQRMLQQDRRGSSVRHALNAAGCRTIPKDVGAYLPAVHATQFKFSAYHTKKEEYVLYPYTYNYELNNMGIQSLSDIRTQCTKPIRLNVNNPGIFMEPNIEHDTTRLILTTSELGACILYSACRVHTFKLLPIVYVTGLPLPRAYKHITDITVVAFNESPITIPYALGLTSDSVFDDGTNTTIRVLNLNAAAKTLPAFLYESIFYNKLPTYEIKDWITKTLKNRDTTVDPVYNADTIDTERLAVRGIPLVLSRPLKNAGSPLTITVQQNIGDEYDVLEKSINT